MANKETDVEITFKINGITETVNSVEEATEALKKYKKGITETKKETKELGSEQGFIAGKIGDLKKTFAGLKGDFKNAALGIKTFFKSGTTGAKILKGALATLGIPLLIAAVAALVDYFKNFEVVARTVSKVVNALGAVISNVGKAFKLLASGEFSAAFNTLKDAAVGAVAATDALYDSENELAQLRKKNATQNAQYRQDIEKYKKILEDTTKTEKERLNALAEVTKRTKLLGEAQLAETDAEIKGLAAKVALENNEMARRDLEVELAQLRGERITQQTELNGVEYDAQKVGREITAEIRDKRIAAEQELADILKKVKLDSITDREQQAIATLALEEKELIARAKGLKANKDELLAIETSFQIKKKAIVDAAQAEQDAIAQVEKDRIQSIADLVAGLTTETFANVFDQARADLAAQEEAALASLKKLTKEGENTEVERLAIKNAFIKKSDQLDIDQAKFKRDLDQKETEEKLAVVAGAFDSIAALAGENSKVGKAAAVASAVINTYQGATKALAELPAPFSFISAAATVAAGFASVKKILAVKVPDAGGSGSSGGSGTTSTPSLTPPSIPAGANIDPNAILRSRNNGQGSGLNAGVSQTGTKTQTVMRAYVVGSDISSAAEADKKISDLARL